ncbi:MAG: hypothetical protein HY294_02070 [Candidatus Rokubacteria bacterium]|nr:hypothetical protein [Candidatus Rokubacteria bacterium]
MVFSPRAAFALARRLRAPGGAPLGDVMSFVSGLYFRGTLAYARAFARPPDPACPIAAGGVLVITPHLGLVAADLPVTLAGLRAAARVDIRADNRRYRRPLEATAHALAARVGENTDVVLLGSVASDKYVAVLGAIFGARLKFPLEFVGRGDMSRGGLLLRCVREGRELTYVPVAGSARHGARPPRLTPSRRPEPAGTLRQPAGAGA